MKKQFIAYFFIILFCSNSFAAEYGATCAPTLPEWQSCQKTTIPWSNLVVNTVNLASGNYTSPIEANLDNTRYVLQGDITASSTAINANATNIIIDLNGHKITYNEESPGSGVRILKYSDKNVAVINGSILQGSDTCEGDYKGAGCNAISCATSVHIDSGDCSRGGECDLTPNTENSVESIHIANIYAKVSGKDVSVISIRGNSPVIEQCVLEDTYEFGTLKYRDYGTAGIRMRDADGGIARYNTIINARHSGIVGDYLCSIYGNDISTRTISTNGQGIHPGPGTNCYSNKIVARGEHPIGILQTVKEDGYETLIHDNYINVKTTALGNEYGSAYLADKNSTITGNFAVGFRTTWGMKGIKFYNNTVYGESDSNYTGTYSPTGEVAHINGGVRGLMIGGASNEEICYVNNNTIETIDKDGTGNAYGISITANRSSGLFVTNNTVSSNITGVALSDVYSRCEGYPLLKNNSHIKVDNYERYNTYANMYNGYFSSEVRIVDEQYFSGASDESVLMYPRGGGVVDLYFGTYDEQEDKYSYYKRIHDNNNTSSIAIIDTYDPMITLPYANPGDAPVSQDPTCDINNLNLCDQSGCDALGKYWYDGVCNANAEPVGPEDPTPDPEPETTSGPILRTGTHLLRVGDSVLRVQ